MKGPGLRIGLDVRRVWRCPKCGKKSLALGNIVAQRCNCSDEPSWMTLDEPMRHRPQPPARGIVERSPDEELGDDTPPVPPASPVSEAIVTEVPSAEVPVSETPAPEVSSAPQSSEQPATPEALAPAPPSAESTATLSEPVSDQTPPELQSPLDPAPSNPENSTDSTEDRPL